MVALAVSQSLATLEWLGGHFSPATLFATSEPGVWYDPSDVANTLWVRNLLTFTEQFDNAIWTKNNFLAFGSGSVANTTATTDPLGGNTADLLVTAAATTTTRVFQGINSNIGQVNTTTWYVKKQTGSAVRWLRLAADQSGAGINTYFDLDNGVFGTVGAGITPFVVSLPNGWYRVGITYSAVATDTSDNQFLLLANGNNMIASYVGDGTSGFYIWGAQTEISSTPTEYQPITTVNAGTLARFPQATLYQDSAGTTPVTTPNQPVGLMLDKSQGLVLGSELQTNGDFSGGTTGWTLGSAWSIVSGRAFLNTTGTGSILSGSVTPVVGKVYLITFDFEYVSGTALVRIGGTTYIIPSVSGSYTARISAASTAVFQFSANTTVAQYYIDNISVREVLGNHATQSTSGSRPTYGIVPATGRRNLFIYTEDMSLLTAPSTTARTNIGITSNLIANPLNGAIDADRITPTAGTAVHEFRLAGSLNVETYSFYIKPDGIRYVAATWSSSTRNAAFDLIAGTVIQPTDLAAGTSTIELLTNGWCRISFPRPSASNDFRLAVVDSYTRPANAATSTCNGTDGFYLWGAQLELGSTATAYQKVVTTFEVTEANVASLSYISFDGIDDFMVTPTITPGTDKVQVFAGVRKLSDAAFAMFLELSPPFNNGRFGISAPSAAATANYQFATLGTSATFPTAIGFAAPITNVLTAFSDISAPNAIVRVNGTQQAQSTSTQGTGNYLAYPLYIGRRGGTSNPFNGQMYGLITRFGANLNTSQLVSTEGWLNTKTGAY